MTPLGMVSAAIVSCWLGLTAIMQFRSCTTVINRFDPFRLVPIWTFFAPNPGVVDYHIVVRDEYSDGSVGSWVPLDIARDRNALNLLWNPQKRAKKILIDAVQSLIAVCKQPSYAEGQEVVSLPYILLLHLAETAPESEKGRKRRQFAIVESSGHSEKTLQLSYLSQFHNQS
jgi:hypothetical protein